MQTMAPTQEVYQELQRAYDWFNLELFDNMLPHCLITLQREKDTCGYFSENRFANLSGHTVDEIAINPAYFAITPLVETLQTICHEQAHLFQARFGKPGRGRYHNEEWAAKMESIGLMPSSTGKPGGKRTGDRMADYPIEGGLFLRACEELITDAFRISWYDRFPSSKQYLTGAQSFGLSLPASVGGAQTVSESAGIHMSMAVPEQMHAPTAMKAGSTRTKYTCKCGFNVWGKPGLLIGCGTCKTQYQDTALRSDAETDSGSSNTANPSHGAW
jgi:predicted SprT family Zn-dependent metalloprotease